VGAVLIVTPIVLFPGIRLPALHHLITMTLGTKHQHAHHRLLLCKRVLLHTVKQKSRTKTLPVTVAHDLVRHHVLPQWSFQFNNGTKRAGWCLYTVSDSLGGQGRVLMSGSGTA
jgi:hypothetical protein